MQYSSEGYVSAACVLVTLIINLPVRIWPSFKGSMLIFLTTEIHISIHIELLAF